MEWRGTITSCGLIASRTSSHDVQFIRGLSYSPRFSVYPSIYNLPSSFNFAKFTFHAVTFASSFQMPVTIFMASTASPLLPNLNLPKLLRRSWGTTRTLPCQGHKLSAQTRRINLSQRKLLAPTEKRCRRGTRSLLTAVATERAFSFFSSAVRELSRIPVNTEPKRLMKVSAKILRVRYTFISIHPSNLGFTHRETAW